MYFAELEAIVREAEAPVVQFCENASYLNRPKYHLWCKISGSFSQKGDFNSDFVITNWTHTLYFM